MLGKKPKDYPPHHFTDEKEISLSYKRLKKTIYSTTKFMLPEINVNFIKPMRCQGFSLTLKK